MLQDLIKRLEAEAAACCDEMLAQLLREAAAALRGKVGTCKCGAQAAILGQCRACYQRARRAK